jgi:hypothetical protein
MPNFGWSAIKFLTWQHQFWRGFKGGTTDRLNLLQQDSDTMFGALTVLVQRVQFIASR